MRNNLTGLTIACAKHDILCDRRPKASGVFVPEFVDVTCACLGNFAKGTGVLSGDRAAITKPSLNLHPVNVADIRKILLVPQLLDQVWKFKSRIIPRPWRREDEGHLRAVRGKYLLHALVIVHLTFGFRVVADPKLPDGQTRRDVGWSPCGIKPAIESAKLSLVPSWEADVADVGG